MAFQDGRSATESRRTTPAPWHVDVANRDLTSAAGVINQALTGAPPYRKWLYEIIEASDDINAAGEHTANARLIASAPDLYEALQSLRPFISTCKDRINGCDHPACAAVNNAEAVLVDAKFGRRAAARVSA